MMIMMMMVRDDDMRSRESVFEAAIPVFIVWSTALHSPAKRNESGNTRKREEMFVLIPACISFLMIHLNAGRIIVRWWIIVQWILKPQAKTDHSNDDDDHNSLTQFIHLLSFSMRKAGGSFFLSKPSDFHYDLKRSKQYVPIKKVGTQSFSFISKKIVLRISGRHRVKVENQTIVGIWKIFPFHFQLIVEHQTVVFFFMWMSAFRFRQQKGVVYGIG